MPRHSRRPRDCNQLRIIGGELRSRLIRFPAVEGLRPSSNRVRETLFNWLRNHLAASCCLDLFAGSGALGIEALSRGAASVHFVEINQQVADSLQRNLALLQAGSATVSICTAQDWIQSAVSGQGYDLVFIDPPFEQELSATTCNALAVARLLNAGALVYLECSKDMGMEDLLPCFTNLKSSKAGQVHFSLWQYEPNS